MAKNISRHVTHLKSKVVENNKSKVPAASDLYEGEIAVNYAKGYETLSIKNESGDVVTFLPRENSSARNGETVHTMITGTTGAAGGTNLSASWSGTCVEIKDLYDGLTILYKTPNTGYTSGVTLSLNGGEKHVVVLNNSSALTNQYPTGTALLLTYDSSVTARYYSGSSTQAQVAGVWKTQEIDTNTTYTVVDNTYARYANYKAKNAIYRYMMLLQYNDEYLLPVNTNSNTTATTKTITQEEFDPFGNIYFYNVTATTNADVVISTGRCYQQILADLRYSFNTASGLTPNKSVYLVAEQQSDGKAKLYIDNDSFDKKYPITQQLPTAGTDKRIYIYLGNAYDTYRIQLTINHPVYKFQNGKLVSYTNDDGITNIQYGELVTLKNDGALIPGMYYRITDYQCTTTQDDTSAATHSFDIIVRADDVNVLNENATAAHHSGDTYFENSKLEAWQLKYSLENDTTKYAWADETDGKGVIYYMKDEWNNECPYDFKNILYKRWAVRTDPSVADPSISGLDGKYLGIEVLLNNDLQPELVLDENEQTQPYFKYFYTFNVYNNDTDSDEDASVAVNIVSPKYEDTNGDICVNNVIKEAYWYVDDYGDFYEDNRMILPNIVFEGEHEPSSDTFVLMHNNFFDNQCAFNTFSNGCFNNRFGKEFYKNTAGVNFINNIFEGVCFTNTFSNNFNTNYISKNFFRNVFDVRCGSNTFSQNSRRNKIGQGCSGNTFGVNFQDNTLGSGCTYNTFGAYCQLNTLSSGCTYNTFGNGVQSNNLGSGCTHNTFGNGCNLNVLNHQCMNNIFDNSCQSNNLGSGSTNNNFGTSCQGNTIGSGCTYNTFGKRCSGNTFGNYCTANTFACHVTICTFGNYCTKNDIATNCNHITFSKNYTQYVTIEGFNQYITVTSTASPSASAFLRNFTITKGINTRTTTKTISHNTLNDEFLTRYIARNTTDVTV